MINNLYLINLLKARQSSGTLSNRFLNSLVTKSKDREQFLLHRMYIVQCPTIKDKYYKKYLEVSKEISYINSYRDNIY